MIMPPKFHDGPDFYAAIHQSGRQNELVGVVPYKNALFRFYRDHDMPHAAKLWDGDMSDPYPPEALPDCYCLKPVDGHSSQGVFLMRRGTDLARRKTHSCWQSLRDDYLRQSQSGRRFSTCYWAEQLLLRQGEPAEDLKVYCFRGEPAMYVHLARFKKQQVALYDAGWECLRRVGNLMLASHTKQVIEQCVRRVSAVLAPRFLRVDLLLSDQGVFHGELNRTSGAGQRVWYIGQDDAGQRIARWLGTLCETAK